MATTTPAAPAFYPCREMVLPDDLLVPAAEEAIRQNASNRPNMGRILEGLRRFAKGVSAKLVEQAIEEGDIVTPQGLACMTAKYWGAGGVVIPTAFMEQTPSDLQNRILGHMNEWGEWCNGKFALAALGSSICRITLRGDGYWCYLGTDLKMIPRNQASMCLQNFNMNTPESEYRRVVRHEAGHALGFPHEHMRQEIVALLDPQKTIAYFQRTCGWSAQQTTQQVLTPINNAALLHPDWSPSDQESIMCYVLPGECTYSGQPIVGGLDLNDSDRAYANSIYPSAIEPPKPPPPKPPPYPAGIVTIQAKGLTELAIDGRLIWELSGPDPFAGDKTDAPA